VWPYLEKLSKEGELGRRKITQYTRYGTILLSSCSRLASRCFWSVRRRSPVGLPLVEHPGFAFRLMTVLTLTTGSCFVMWLGEQITERGIGNGMSLIHLLGNSSSVSARGHSDDRSDAHRADRADSDAHP